MDFLFTLGFIAGVCLGDGLKALPQPFAGGILLGISEKLVGLRPDLPAFIISQLLTHLLNQYQQRPPCALTIATPFCNSTRPLDNRFCLLLMPETAENQPLGGECFGKESVFT